MSIEDRLSGTTDDPELFRKRWEQHVQTLESLKLSLPPERMSEIDEHIEDLEELIELGADTVGGKR